jgi:hypothetical protein
MAVGRKTLFDVSMVIDENESVLKFGSAEKVEYTENQTILTAHEPGDYDTTELIPAKRTATGNIIMPRFNGELAKRVFPKGSKPLPFTIIGTLRGTSDQVVKLVKCYANQRSVSWDMEDYAKNNISINITKVEEL